MASEDRRVEIVNEHMRLENAHDFAACAAVFAHPRYEIPADDVVYDGAEEVQGFLGENKEAFPDFRFEPSRVSPGPDAVVVEGRFKGTHEGLWRGLPPTGRKVDFPMCLVFEFEGESMINERVYMDLATPLRQLGVAYDPDSVRFKLVTAFTHPVSITRAAVRTVWMKVTRRDRR